MERKTKNLMLRLTESQYNAITAAARRVGLSYASWARFVTLYAAGALEDAPVVIRRQLKRFDEPET